MCGWVCGLCVRGGEFVLVNGVDSLRSPKVADFVKAERFSVVLAVAVFVIIPSVFVFGVFEAEFFEGVAVCVGVASYPEPRATNLYLDAVKVYQLFENVAELLGGFFRFFSSLAV